MTGLDLLTIGDSSRSGTFGVSSRASIDMERISSMMISSWLWSSLMIFSPAVSSIMTSCISRWRRLVSSGRILLTLLIFLLPLLVLSRLAASLDQSGVRDKMINM